LKTVIWIGALEIVILNGRLMIGMMIGRFKNVRLPGRWRIDDACTRAAAVQDFGGVDMPCDLLPDNT